MLRIILGVFFLGTLTGQEAMVVQLATDQKLAPLYIAPISDQQSGFSKGYVKELEEVLRFDFDYNGSTFVMSNKGDWREIGAYYAIEAEVRDKKLSATIYSLYPEMAKRVENLELTGHLSRDRRVIHQLSDQIHSLLFQKPGIASSRFLFTLRHPIPGTEDQWRSEVWEADYDGQNTRQVTHNRGYAVTPTYVPNSQLFMYVGYETGQSKIYVGSLQSGQVKRLSYMHGNQLMPAVSPQSNMIAFVSDVTTNPDLFVQPYDPKSGPIGKPRQIYYAHLKTQGTPSFSPDGKQLAFVTNRGGRPQVYIMTIPPAGSRRKDVKVRQLTRFNRESTAPAWSPDGKKIAYTALTEGTRQIWVYDLVKGEERQLTQGAKNKENPTWAADSLHLIYNTTDPKSAELFLVNLNQREAVQISSGSGEKRFPSWHR